MSKQVIGNLNITNSLWWMSLCIRHYSNFLVILYLCVVDIEIFTLRSIPIGVNAPLNDRTV